MDNQIDKVMLFDENNFRLSDVESMRVKKLLYDSLEAKGLISVELKDLIDFFGKKHYLLHCKTFVNPTAGEMQKFAEKNTIKCAMMFNEMDEETPVDVILAFIPSIEQLFFAMSIIPRKEIVVTLLY